MTGKLKDQSEWIICESHEAIISDEIFNSVNSQIKIDAPDSGAGSPHSSFVFTGILKCDACGSSMQIETAKGRNKRYSYYNCRQAQQSLSCENRRISADTFDEWLIDVITYKIFNKKYVLQIMTEMHEFCGEWTKDRNERRQKLLKSIYDIEAKNNKLYETLELFGKDAPNLGDLTIRLRSNNKKFKSLEQDLIDIDNEVAPAFSFNECDVHEFSAMLIDIVRTTEDPKKLRHFFGGFVNSVTVSDETVKIEYDQTKLLGSTTVVPSKESWLPDFGGSITSCDCHTCAIPARRTRRVCRSTHSNRH